VRRFSFLALFLLPLTSFSIGFEEAYLKIKSDYPAFGQIENQLAAAKSRTLPGYFQWLPSLTAVATQNDSSSAYDVFTRSRSIGLTSQLSLFSGGSNWAELRLSRIASKSADLAYSKRFLELEAEALSALLNYIYQQEKLEIAYARIENKEQSIEIAQRMFKKGRIPRSEYEKLSIELSNAKAQLEDSRLAEFETQANLLRYLEGEKLDIKWPWVDSLPTVIARIEVKSDQNSLEENLDYLSVKQSLEAQDYLLMKSRAALMPNLALVGSYGRSYEHFTPLGDSNAWSLGLTLSIPLFQKFSAWGPYRAQVHQNAASAKAFELTKRETRKSISFSRSEMLVATKSAVARDKILNQSRSLFEKSLKLFQSGRIDVNTLGNDEDRWLTSRELAVDGWRRAHLAFINFCHTRGQSVDSCRKL